MKPRYWTDVYPQGTPEGNEEFEFFNALCRDKNIWLKTYHLHKITGLDEERIEEIIQKYVRLGMVFQHAKHDDQWAYWERVPERLPKAVKPLHRQDQEDRIGRAAGFDDADDDAVFTKVMDKR